MRTRVIVFHFNVSNVSTPSETRAVINSQLGHIKKPMCPNVSTPKNIETWIALHWLDKYFTGGQLDALDFILMKLVKVDLITV